MASLIPVNVFEVAGQPQPFISPQEKEKLLCLIEMIQIVNQSSNLLWLQARSTATLRVIYRTLKCLSPHLSGRWVKIITVSVLLITLSSGTGLAHGPLVHNYILVNRDRRMIMQMRPNINNWRIQVKSIQVLLIIANF